MSHAGTASWLFAGIAGLVAGMTLLTASAAELAASAQAQAAPKPARLADGKPNWTGFWIPPGGLLDVYRGPGGITPPAGQAQTAGPPPGFKIPFIRTAPLKSPYKEQSADYIKQLMTGKVSDPVALCYPPGMPGMMVAIYGIEILQTPGQITITSEWQAASRRVWMNDKSHPAEDELDPTYAGHSIGRWEGDTLVVDTVGIRSDVRIGGVANSGKRRIVERFSQTSPGILVDEMTIEDPDVYETPWKETFTYSFRPELRLQEYTCLENNRNVGPNGEAVF